MFFAIFTIVVVIFLIVAPYFILPNISNGRNQWLNNTQNTTTFLELWEIDTFEGGTASRANFLENRKNANLLSKNPFCGGKNVSDMK